jgi:hypothetical protein
VPHSSETPLKGLPCRLCCEGVSVQQSGAASKRVKEETVRRTLCCASNRTRGAFPHFAELDSPIRSINITQGNHLASRKRVCFGDLKYAVGEAFHTLKWMVDAHSSTCSFRVMDAIWHDSMHRQGSVLDAAKSLGLLKRAAAHHDLLLGRGHIIAIE